MKLTWLCIGLGFLAFLSGVTNAQSVIVPDKDGKLVFKLNESELEGDHSIKVWVGQKRADVPPLAGETSLEDDRAEFSPRFPLRSRLSYHVELHRNGKLVRSAKVAGKAVNTVQTAVKAIYPSADSIPENTLRFYLQFSAPMSKGKVYRFVRIREAGGETVELPFLEIEQEFWSRDSKRLTLLLDPGRVKRGLKPRMEMGPIFRVNQTYELIVDGRWPDANGNPLGQDFAHRYKITQAKHKRLSIKEWQVQAPSFASRAPLTITWNSSLDYGMLQRTISVLNKQGAVVAGTAKLGNKETSWSFTPTLEWQADKYTLEIDSTLEDVCGNNFLQPFDVDMTTVPRKPVKSNAKLTIEFTPKQKSPKRE
ncbi:MAG: hypothetical protein AAF497_12165 [Planctomycetota bacterium]